MNLIGKLNKRGCAKGGLLNSIFLYGIAAGLGRAGGIVLLPILTRILSPAEYGTIELLTVSVTLVVIIADLELYSGVGREFYSVGGIEGQRMLVSTGLIAIGVLTTAFTVLALLGSKFLVGSRFGDNSEGVVVLAVIWIPVLAVYTYMSAIMRYAQRPGIFLLVGVSQLALKTIVTVWLVVQMKLGIAGVMIGNIVSDIVASMVLAWGLKEYIRRVFDLDRLKRLVVYSIPLTLSYLVSFLHNSLSRYWLASSLSLEAVGRFGVAMRLASVISIAGLAFRMAWEPFLVSRLVKGNHRLEFKVIYVSVLAGAGLVVAIICILSEDIVALAAGQTYRGTGSLLGIVAVALAVTLLSSIVGLGPIVTRKTKALLLCNVGGLLANILSLLFLSPMFGAIGAAYSLLLGSCVTFSLLWIVTERTYGVGFPLFPTILIGILVLGLALLPSLKAHDDSATKGTLIVLTTLAYALFMRRRAKTLFGLP